MAFAQFTYRESLRDIEACLGSMSGKLYHMGFRSRIARSTLSDANEAHDWRIFADFALHLVAEARPLHAEDPMGVDLEHSLYALDSPTIDLCLTLFPWAKFRHRKGAVKMHTLLDLHGNIPTFIRITDGKVHDVNILDDISPEAGAFYVMDRGYVDFGRLYGFTCSSAFFVIRAKKNILLQRRYSHPIDKSGGIRSDHTVILTAIESFRVYPDTLRRVNYFDAETNQRLSFLTNNFALPAMTIARIYKCRWQIELFFKWIKQHLRIKAFFGTVPTPSRLRSGSPSRFMYWSPSSASAWASRPASTKCYRFSASHFSRKRPFHRLSKRRTPRMSYSTLAIN